MTQLASWPGVKAEILPDAPNDPAGAGVWLDVTPYLVLWSTKRGRQDETTNVGPDTMQWKLRNTDVAAGTAGRFDPFNAASPYYPNLKINRQARMRLQWASTGNLLTTNAASVETDASGWAGVYNVDLAQSSTFAADGTSSLRANLHIGPPDNLAFHTVGGAFVTPLETYTAMFSVRSDVARSVQVAIEWTNAAGTTIATSSGTTATSTTTGFTQLVVSAVAPAGAFIGLVYAQVNAVASTGEFHYFDKAGIFRGTVSTWAAGSGVIYPLFRGYEDTGWPQTYDARGRYGYCTPTFVSATSFLGKVGLLDCVLQEMLTDAPLALYPLSDGGAAAGNISATKQANAGLVVDVLGTASFGNATITPTLAGTSLRVVDTSGGAPGSTSPCGAALVLPSTAVPTSGGLTMDVWMRTVKGGNSETDLMWANDSTATNSVGVIQSGSGLKAQITWSGGGLSSSQVGTVNDGKPHHVALTLASDGKTVTLYLDGVQKVQIVASTALTQSGLTVASIGNKYVPASTGGALQRGTADATFQALATYPGALTGTRIAAHYTAGLNAFAGDSAGTQINRLLSYASWLPALKSIDATSLGDLDTPMQGMTGLNGSNVTAEMQKIANSANGDLDVSGDGKIRYRSRDYRTLQTAPAVTFGENTGEIAYTTAPDIGQKRDQLVGGVIVNQRNGVKIVRGNAQSVLDGNGVKSYDVSLANPVQVIDFADDKLVRYQTGHERLTSWAVNPIGDPSMWAQILGLDFGTRKRVMRRPNGLYTKTIDGYIESIGHDVVVDFNGGTKWAVTFTGSPLPPFQGWILGDATYGVLGTTTKLSF